MISCQNTGIGEHCSAATPNSHSTVHTSKSSCIWSYAAVGFHRCLCTSRSSAPFFHLHKQIFLFLNPLKTSAGRISRIFLIKVSCHASQNPAPTQGGEVMGNSEQVHGSERKVLSFGASVTATKSTSALCMECIYLPIDKCIYKSWEQTQTLLSQMKPTANFLLAWNCCLISFSLPCLLLAILCSLICIILLLSPT